MWVQLSAMKGKEERERGREDDDDGDYEICRKPLK